MRGAVQWGASGGVFESWNLATARRSWALRAGRAGPTAARKPLPPSPGPVPPGPGLAVLPGASLMALLRRPTVSGPATLHTSRGLPPRGPSGRLSPRHRARSSSSCRFHTLLAFPFPPAQALRPVSGRSSLLKVHLSSSPPLSRPVSALEWGRFSQESNSGMAPLKRASGALGLKLSKQS